MGHLRREFAPLSSQAWKALDEAVAEAARHVLTARRVATFDGPKGWDYVGARLGSVRPCHTASSKASVCVPDVSILSEIRADFGLPWTIIDAFERGAPELDTEAAEAAAHEVAMSEDTLLLYGDPVGGGFLTSPASPRIEAGDWTQPGQLLHDLVQAVTALDSAGIPGPYEAALPPAGYVAYLQAIAEGGYPVMRQLERVLAGVHRSLVLRERGAVFSVRGGDFVITVGADLAVGYRYHDASGVQLTCIETVGGQSPMPEAVCLLR
jgi:uncharacterized linocin/CFP29 family protein